MIYKVVNVSFLFQVQRNWVESLFFMGIFVIIEMADWFFFKWSKYILFFFILNVINIQVSCQDILKNNDSRLKKEIYLN